MIIYPAIDLRGGTVVRLKEGNPNRQTTFSTNPIDTAQHWVTQGANWIHMVNLDGAFQHANSNLEILERAARLDVKIQFGGGLRTVADIETALRYGASRVILGTIAVENPDLVGKAVSRFGADRISVALDVRDGKVATHGWQTSTSWTPIRLSRMMSEQGVIHALFTDVKRDGSLIGSNVEETITLGRETGLHVVASGGITSVHEIETLARSRYVAGVVIGMALYENQLTLGEALLAAKAG